MKHEIPFNMPIGCMDRYELIWSNDDDEYTEVDGKISIELNASQYPLLCVAMKDEREAIADGRTFLLINDKNANSDYEYIVNDNIAFSTSRYRYVKVTEAGLMFDVMYNRGTTNSNVYKTIPYRIYGIR